MKSKRVYVNTFNLKRSRIFKEDFLREKNKGSKVIFILPNGDLIRDYRHDYIKEMKLVDDLKLFTFDDLINEITENIALLEREMKILFLKRIIDRMSRESNLELLAGGHEKEGLVEDIINFITYLKQEMIRHEDLEGKNLGPLYEEVINIYNNYNVFLEDKGIYDREDQYMQARDKIESNLTYRDYHIYIDGFYDFRKIEWEIIRELSKYNHIYINIPFKLKGKSSILDRTLKDLEDLEFELIYEDYEETSYEKLASDFKNYREILDHSINIIEASSEKLEVKGVINQINRLHREGLDLDQMAIISLDKRYDEIIEVYMEEEAIYLNKTKYIDMSLSKLMLEIIGLLKDDRENINKKSFLNILDREYFSLGERSLRREIFNEIYLRDFYEINDLRDYLKGESLSDFPSKALLVDIIDKIQLRERLTEEGSIVYYCDYIEEKIKEYEIKEQIFLKMEEDMDFYASEARVLVEVKNILKELRSFDQVIGSITREDFVKMFQGITRDKKIYIGERNRKGVDYLELIKFRSKKYKVVFFLGMNSSIFPRLINKNYFLAPNFTDELRLIGLDKFLYESTLDNEEIKFLKALSLVEDEVYFSYDKSKGDSQSFFLEEVKLKTREENINTIVYDFSKLASQVFNEIGSKSELEEYSILNRHDSRIKVDLETLDYLKGLMEKTRVYRREELENMNYNGYLGEGYLDRDLDRVYSSTMIEAYMDCPYMFYLRYILKVDHKDYELEDEMSLNFGNIYHLILKDYYFNFKDSIREYVEGNDFIFENTEDYLKKIIELYYGEFYGMTSKKEVEVDIIYLKMKKLILEDLDRLKDRGLYPLEFEKSFGYKDEVYLENSQGEKIKIRGQVDRIDQSLKGDHMGLVDYKTSSYGIPTKKDFLLGKSIQLPFYMIGLKNYNFQLGTYGVIKDGEFKDMLVNAEYFPEEKKIDGESIENLLNEVRDNIFTIVNKIEKGQFPIEPENCSKYCKYRSICRYKSK